MDKKGITYMKIIIPVMAAIVIIGQYEVTPHL